MIIITQAEASIGHLKEFEDLSVSTESPNSQVTLLGMQNGIKYDWMKYTEYDSVWSVILKRKAEFNLQKFCYDAH